MLQVLVAGARTGGRRVTFALLCLVFVIDTASACASAGCAELPVDRLRFRVTVSTRRGPHRPMRDPTAVC